VWIGFPVYAAPPIGQGAEIGMFHVKHRGL
jgi:hypothetical protein